MDMDQIRKVAKRNQERARQVLKETKIEEIWQSIGAEINLVGSLRLGLLVKHLDIDLHIYSKEMKIADSFRAMSKLAENPRIKKITYNNLLDAEDACLEWHAWYEDQNSDLWQLDMMHIIRGSKYEGYFEKVADKILEKATEQQKEIIMKLKYETPDDIKIMGIEYYVAVLSFDMQNFAEFQSWRDVHKDFDFMNWQP